MTPKDPQLVDVLNDVLSAELTAINQYFVHAKMCGNWGYKKLHAFIRHESIDEMKHAEAIMERILFLDGVPNLQRLYKLNVGETVDEQFQSDVALEYAAVERLNKGIQLATAAGDNGTRALLEKILVSEEEHIDWLETQLETIRQVGLPNYLTQQMRE
ncbi:MAG: bacterioferritin [Myxococcota bacterium]